MFVKDLVYLLSRIIVFYVFWFYFIGVIRAYKSCRSRKISFLLLNNLDSFSLFCEHGSCMH